MNKNTKIVWKPIDDLIPYEHNAKEHTETQINNLAKSFEQNGWQNIVLIDENDVIIYGHGRCLGAKKAGLTEAPCVVCTDLSEEEIKRFRHLDNLLSEGDYIQEAFDLDLPDLSDYDFSELELNINLLGELDDFDVDKIIEDEAPEVDEEAEPICKLGDIWQLGKHRVICGNSTDKAVIDRLMDGVKADMVFTDPPYGYNYQSNMRTKTEKFDVLENDDKILDFFPNLLGRVKGFVMICTTWKVLDKWLPLFKQYFDLSNMIIWDKGGGYIGDLEHTFGTDYEIILCANNGAKLRDKRIGSVWSINKDSESDYKHPTQKPVALSANAIKHTTDKGQNVLDVFGGSGSTLIACEQLNRKCYMCELDPKYCDVIIQRWENFTGEKAVKVS